MAEVGLCAACELAPAEPGQPWCAECGRPLPVLGMTLAGHPPKPPPQGRCPAVRPSGRVCGRPVLAGTWCLRCEQAAEGRGLR